MTDLSCLRDHPANQFAAECPKEMDAPPDPSAMSLLALAREWLRRAPPNSLPWAEYQTELLERAELLAADDPVWAAALLVSDFESLEQEAESLPPGKLRWEALSRHLDEPLTELRQKPSAEAAGKLLADNLYTSPNRAYPAFGHPSE
jgi:hypothetical protein